jgi:N-methylhydantoinase A
LVPGDRLNGPALIIEGQTTTVVGPRFDAVIDEGANIVMSRRSVAES